MANIYDNSQIDLTQLTNAKLIERYGRIPYEAPVEVEAARDIIMQNPDGFAPVADRQVILNYLTQEEPHVKSNNNLKFRRINGGKRRKSKRDIKSIKSRKIRKSRKSIKSRRR